MYSRYIGITRAIFARYTHARMTRQHVISDNDHAYIDFCCAVQGVIDGLKIVKREHKQYKAMFQRKFLILCYLHGISEQRTRFSQQDLIKYFSNPKHEYAIAYWNKLISEGWINEVEYSKKKDANRKPRKLVKPCGVLSPFCLSLLRLVWGARLRRVVGYPNASANKLKQHGKRAQLPTGEMQIKPVPGCKPVKNKPTKTALDSLFQDIKDERI